MQRTIGHFWILLLFLFVTGCTVNLQFDKRKYRPGFYFENTGSVLEVRERTNRDTTLQRGVTASDEHGIVPSATQKLKQENCVPEMCTVYNAVSHSEMTNKNSVTQTKDADDPCEYKRKDDPAPAEKDKQLRNTVLFSIAGYLCSFGCTFLWAISMPAFWICFGLAMICGLMAWIFGRKVQSRYKKDEKYKGKLAVVFSKIVGVLTILVAILVVAISIGSNS